MQTAFLMADDIMDNSSTDVGSFALNDCFMLENLVYHLLKKYMGRDRFYVPLLELFLETSMRTILGQCMNTKLTQQYDLNT